MIFINKEIFIFYLTINIIINFRFPIKDCQKTVLKAYDISVSKRKVYLDCKRVFEKVYGAWEGSFA